MKHQTTVGPTLRVLGHQLPPQGASCQQSVAKGAALRSPWAPKVPDAPLAQKAPEGNFASHFAPQHYP